MSIGSIAITELTDGTTAVPYFDNIRIEEYFLGVEMEVCIGENSHSSTKENEICSVNYINHEGINSTMKEKKKQQHEKQDPFKSCKLKSFSECVAVTQTDQEIIKHKTRTDFSDKPKLRIRYWKEEYMCNNCSYKSTVQNAYLEHMRQHNAGKFESVKISCVVCGADFDTKGDLVTHMNRHKDGPFMCCDYCIFRSVQLKKVIQHRRIHTGEKPHLCPYCSYRSSRRDNMRSHVRRLHNIYYLYKNTFSPPM